MLNMLYHKDPSARFEKKTVCTFKHLNMITIKKIYQERVNVKKEMSKTATIPK